MISNLSGKFEQTIYSHASASQDTPDSGEEDLGFNPADTGETGDESIPPCPEEDTMTKIRRLFGELWWLWIAAFVIYLVTRKK